MASTKTITAVFDTRFEAESALRKLEHAGFTQKEINMLVTEEILWRKKFRTVPRPF